MDYSHFSSFQKKNIVFITDIDIYYQRHKINADIFSCSKDKNRKLKNSLRILAYK